MASGVEVADECKTAFTDIKLGHKHRYVVFGLTDDLKKITVLKRADKEATYDDLCAELKEDVCRYVVFDLEYQASGEQNQSMISKLFFLAWVPDTAKIKQKMVYASSKDALKKALGTGVGMEVQASDISDLAYEDVKSKVSKLDRH